jgi:hypothetical protein
MTASQTARGPHAEVGFSATPHCGRREFGLDLILDGLEQLRGTA